MFGSKKHIAFLEAELTRCRAEHRDEIKSLREDHQKELEYARKEMARLQVEVDRLLLQITTGKTQITAVEPVDSEEGMKKLTDVLQSTFMGTPFQRILAREQKTRDAADAARRNALPAKETNNGGS